MPVTITSHLPAWKTELLQKRAEKLKVESVEVPEWKKKLIQRLHDKTEAVKKKMEEEAKKSNDKMVLDEPILKVSDNIFMRKELERKLSGQGSSNKKFNFDIGVAGHRVTRKDNMVIIEKSEGTTNRKGEIHEFELPNAGIVSRMRGRFSSNDGNPPFRSKSSDDILNIDNDEYPPSPSSPVGDSAALARNVDHMKPLPQDRQNKRYSSVDAILTQDYDNSSRITRISKPYKANFSTKKFSAPPSPTSKKPSLTNETIDLTSLHAPGSPTRPVTKTRSTENPPQSQPRPKLSDRTQEFTKDMGSLHASSTDAYPKNDDEIPLTPETITLIPAPTIPVSAPKERLKHSEAQRPVDGANDDTKASLVTKQEPPSKISHSAVKPSLKESHNKENIPELPKRRNLNITKSWSKTGGSEKSSPGSAGGQIIELGRVSMDASMLKSEAAIAANEIMKESRTIMIVPRGKNTSSKTTLKAHKEPKKDKTAETKICNGEIKVRNEPVSTFTKKSPHPDDKLPASSIDDVVVMSSGVETKKVNAQPKAEVPEVKLVEKEPVKKPVSTGSPVSKPRSFVVNSSSKKVTTSRSTESNAAVIALFGAKLSSSSPSKASFGGKSFVIDPSKFKKSSVQPSAATAAKTTQASKSQVQNVGSSTRVISPKTQSDPLPPTTTEEGSSTPKGKRKLTVDQIVVIGGYVKLDHSSLAKPNKMRKGVHVKFEETQLESIFQYPSEKSLLNEDQQNKLNQRMTSLATNPGLSKDSSLGKYTPKYLLAMKESLNEEDEEEKRTAKESSQTETDGVATDLAIPLADSDATTFSVSSSSSDLLF